ncbi:hypothetical protein Tcan_00287, partial [Toxocara canis]
KSRLAYALHKCAYRKFLGHAQGKCCRFCLWLPSSPSPTDCNCQIGTNLGYSEAGKPVKIVEQRRKDAVSNSASQHCFHLSPYKPGGTAQTHSFDGSYVFSILQ